VIEAMPATESEEVTRESIAGLREEIADLEARITESEASAATLPHRTKYLLLNTAFLRGLLDLHGEWIDDVEEALSGEPGSASA
jgi:hypothetical protein